MENNVAQYLIGKDMTIKDAMKQMSKNGEKVLFVIENDNRLYGSLSDGDIRKWILQGKRITALTQSVCNTQPKVVSGKFTVEHVKRLMLGLAIECVPVVDNANKVLRILTWNNIFADKIDKKRAPNNIQVVIMAGGMGTRLDPFTRILPKPLIPVGEKPIIEIIMDKFYQYGGREFIISVHHKAKMIQSYFEDMHGKYKIRYVHEKKPLGTAGSLRLLEKTIREPFMVTNCDIIIESDFTEITKFHQENNYDITLVVSCRHYVIPYGICEIEEGGMLKSISEKPSYDLLVNTGMYVMNKCMFALIPKNRVLNIDDLIRKAKDKGYKIGVFPISETSWIDIGQWDEYQKALEKLKINL
ncbi:MAG: nucleotidyltransferase family protein [bacterium]